MKNRSGGMLWSVAAHLAGVALLCSYRAPLPELPPVPPPAARVMLVAPPKLVDAPTMQATPLRAKLELPRVRPEQPPRTEAPAPEAPRLAVEADSAIELPLDQPRLEAPPPPPGPVLAAATAAAKDPEPSVVQAAGFEGVPVQAKGQSRAARLNVGAFAGQAGAPGGSPGAGRKAEVRQAGFGGALAGPTAGKRGPTIASGGFGGAIAAGRTSSQPVVAASAGFARVRAEKAEAAAPRSRKEPGVTRVEILSKPKPVYTSEALAARIEGDVSLEVRFGAGGRIEVLRVLRGLGHGLDQAAAQAVEAMLFHPAQRGGTPVDSVLSVAVAFRLAY